MGDEFNENDLVDLNSEVESASEVPDISDDAIQSALDKFYGKASDNDLEEAGVDPDEAAKERELVKRNIARRKASEAEQRQELREEGLEGEDELDEESIVNGEEEVPALKDKQEADGEEVEEKQPTQEAVATPKLDPALRYFAASTLGWTDERIDKLVKADPELAAETISNLAASYTNLSRQLLTAPQQPAGTQQEQQPAQSPTSKLDQIYADLNAFAEANGEELTEFIKALKSELIDPWRAEQAKIEVQKQELNKSEARQTFGKLSTEFAGLYGKQGEARTPEQQKAVADLGEVADQLRAGAKLRGQEMTIADAINRAHLLVSHNYREQAVRKAIKEQVQKRAKGLTAKPTMRQRPAPASGKSKEAAAEALTRKAAELGIAGFDE